MIDVDCCSPVPHGLPLPPSHAAGLHRLSTHGSAPTTPRASPSTASPFSCPTTTPSSSPVLAHLAAIGFSVFLGLSDLELACATSSFLPTSDSTREAALVVDVAGELVGARGV
uniref:Uncharacterized protein n=1 Tax=Oryza punctata TaxID=4537 RepID=A0A0E0LUA3_ORYPU